MNLRLLESNASCLPLGTHICSPPARRGLLDFIRVVLSSSSSSSSSTTSAKSGNWHSIWQIFWHSIWQTFWHFIWHTFWRSIWHTFWHSIWHTFWHSIWHIFWHFIWHIFSHSIWHAIWRSIWHIFWHSIWPLRSSGAHWARQVPGWGPAVRTELGRSQVEVQRCALSWEGPRLRSIGAHWAGKVPGWGPAVRTELGRSQVEVQQCALSSEVGEELGEELARRKWRWKLMQTWSRRNWRRRRRRRRRRTTALIKSNNPHLAGGEKTVPMLYRQKMCQTPFRYVWLPEVPEGTPFGGSMSIFSAIHTVAWDQSVVLRIAFLELRESETSVFTSASEQGSLECWPWELEANWLHPTPFL